VSVVMSSPEQSGTGGDGIQVPVMVLQAYMPTPRPRAAAAISGISYVSLHCS
jgi:hypothetical protein